MTITGNEAGSDQFGGGIFNCGVLCLPPPPGLAARSISPPATGQTQPPLPPGIPAANQLELTNVTIAKNSAVQGSGIWSDDAALGTLKNTLLADNSNGSNCVSGVLASAGHNLSDDASCTFFGKSDLSNTAARLGPLGNYGGPTPSHLPLPNSPALDGGDNAGCPATDQRGENRPFDADGNGTATCDIGAVETAAADAVDGDGDGYGDRHETALGKPESDYCGIMRADVDWDGSVSILDLSSVAGAFGQSIQVVSARLDQGVLPRDGLITILDLSSVAGHFGKPVSACP